jgi:hypothetical protein
LNMFELHESALATGGIQAPRHLADWYWDLSNSPILTQSESNESIRRIRRWEWIETNGPQSPSAELRLAFRVESEIVPTRCHNHN